MWMEANHALDARDKTVEASRTITSFDSLFFSSV
jgi:hypothetical protein